MPSSAKTLIEALDWHVAAHPDQIHVRFLRGDDDIQELTYAGLRRAADDVAAGLRELGLAHGETVAIMLPTCLEFFFAYFGILIAGGVPVPIYPPARLNQIEEHLKRQAAVLTNALAKVLITVPEAKTLARYLRAQNPVPGPRGHHRRSTAGRAWAIMARGQRRGLGVHSIHLRQYGQSERGNADP